MVISEKYASDDFYKLENFIKFFNISLILGIIKLNYRYYFK